MPQLFFKPSSSVIGPEETIVLPAGARRVDAEASWWPLSAESAGRPPPPRRWTTYSDIPAATTSVVTGSATTSSGGGPRVRRPTAIGPHVSTGLDPTNLELRTRVNGEEKQAANTSTLIHSLATIVAFASEVLTLHPGDLVFTGTPGETPTLEDGDVVEVQVDGVGVLRNQARREAADS